MTLGRRVMGSSCSLDALSIAQWRQPSECASATPCMHVRAWLGIQFRLKNYRFLCCVAPIRMPQSPAFELETL